MAELLLSETSNKATPTGNHLTNLSKIALQAHSDSYSRVKTELAMVVRAMKFTPEVLLSASR